MKRNSLYSSSPNNELRPHGVCGYNNKTKDFEFEFRSTYLQTFKISNIVRYGYMKTMQKCECFCPRVWQFLGIANAKFDRIDCNLAFAIPKSYLACRKNAPETFTLLYSLHITVSCGIRYFKGLKVSERESRTHNPWFCCCTRILYADVRFRHEESYFVSYFFRNEPLLSRYW